MDLNDVFQSFRSLYGVQSEFTTCNIEEFIVQGDLLRDFPEVSFAQFSSFLELNNVVWLTPACYVTSVIVPHEDLSRAEESGDIYDEYARVDGSQDWVGQMRGIVVRSKLFLHAQTATDILLSLLIRDHSESLFFRGAGAFATFPASNGVFEALLMNTNCKTAPAVTLSNMMLTPEQCQILARSKLSRLHVLENVECEDRGDGFAEQLVASHIGAAAPSKKVSIPHSTLSHLTLACEKLSEETLEIIIESFGRAVSLRYLTLSGDFRFSKRKSMAIVALFSETNLTNVDISNALLPSEAFGVLFQLPNLLELAVCCQGLPPCFTEGILLNRSIHVLDLYRDPRAVQLPLTNESMDRFFASIRHHPQLYQLTFDSLYVDENRPDYPTRRHHTESLQSVFKTNRTIRKLRLAASEWDETLLSTIQEQVHVNKYRPRSQALLMEAAVDRRALLGHALVAVNHKRYASDRTFLILSQNVDVFSIKHGRRHSNLVAKRKRFQ
jgi:hypothetical protein